MSDDFGRLPVALIPSLPEQEAEAERLVQAGAVGLPQPQQDTPYAVPVDTDHTEPGWLPEDAGNAPQIPSAPPGAEGAAGVTHLHYWVHTVTETVDRGNFAARTFSVPLAPGAAAQLFGLNDLRTRADVTVVAADGSVASGVAVYFGTRDQIRSDNPQTAANIGASGGTTYRARAEAWVYNGTDDAVTISVIEYVSEPNSDELATRSKSSAGAR